MWIHKAMKLSSFFLAHLNKPAGREGT